MENLCIRDEAVSLRVAAGLVRKGNEIPSGIVVLSCHCGLYAEGPMPAWLFEIHSWVKLTHFSMMLTWISRIVFELFPHKPATSLPSPSITNLRTYRSATR